MAKRIPKAVREAAAILGRKGGKSRSPKKLAAARQNARKKNPVVYDTSCEGLMNAAVNAKDVIERRAALFALKELWSLHHPTEPLRLKLPPLQESR